MRRVSLLYRSAGAAEIVISFPSRYEKKIIKNEFWGSFIPGLSVVKDVSPSKSISTIQLMNGKCWKLEKRGRNVFIETIFSNTEIKDIVAVCGYLMEAQRQKKFIYTIHGSLIEKGGMAVALIGGVSGIGKTSIAAYSQSKYGKGWNFVSDEKFLLNGSTGEIAGLISYPHYKQFEALKKNKYPLKLSGRSNPLKLKLIMIPILTNETKLTKIIYEHRKATWHLYEEASRDIRLINGLVNNFSDPLPSLDTEDIATKRVLCARKIAKKIPVFFVRGNAYLICKFIDQQLKNRQRG